MTANERSKLTPFAARVIRRLLDSSLTWREITEAFSVSVGAIERIQRSATGPEHSWAQPGSIRRACHSGRPSGR
ncbi:MAG: hypothetical protein ACYTGF_14640 [Planctomycetota bacterium]|jgi:Trp operon repressor